MADAAVKTKKLEKKIRKQERKYKEISDWLSKKTAKAKEQMAEVSVKISKLQLKLSKGSKKRKKG